MPQNPLRAVVLSRDYLIAVCDAHKLSKTPKRMTVEMMDEIKIKKLQCQAKTCGENAINWVIMEVDI